MVPNRCSPLVRSESYHRKLESNLLALTWGSLASSRASHRPFHTEQDAKHSWRGTEVLKGGKEGPTAHGSLSFTTW